MGTLGGQFRNRSVAQLAAVRRRLGLDAGPFSPARSQRFDEEWIPRGLAPFGFERSRRKGFGSVEQLPTDLRVDNFRRYVQRWQGITAGPRDVLDPVLTRWLVRASACGTPVISVSPDCVGDEIPSLVRTLWGEGLPTEPEAWARLTYQQWAAVHDTFAPTDSLPEVTITLATRRPAYVDLWLPQIVRQKHRSLQVVVVLHDPGFSGVTQERIRHELENAGIQVDIVTVDPTQSLGAALDAARRRAEGDVILKWDDDDLYSSMHVVDMLRARRYSGASLVGKACDFVYFADQDVTIRRHQADREAWSPTLSGNTLMIDRTVLDEVGGWANTSLGEDAELISRVRRYGCNTYRTVGYGMIAIRNAESGCHTWQISSDTPDRKSHWQGLAVDEALVDAPTSITDAVRRRARGER